MLLKQKIDIAPITIVTLYTIAQLACLYIYGYTPYPDSNGYIFLAQESVNANTFYPQSLTDIPFLWNVGAINAVALSLYLFNSITPLLVLYTLMQGAMAWLTFAIARELFNSKVAYLALCLFVLYPSTYGCGTSLLSEVPFIFFSLLALLLMLKEHLLWSGICFAMANYVRPMAIIFIVAAILFMIYKRTKFKQFFLLLIGYFMITCSIGVSNYVTKGKYFTQGAMGWMGLMQYSWDHDSDREADYYLFPNNDPNIIDESLNYDCLQRDSVWRSHFLRWLPNNVGEYFMQMPTKVIKTYISDNVNFCAFLPDKEEREYMYEEISMSVIAEDFPHWSRTQILTVINLIYYYILLILGILGGIHLLKKKNFYGFIIPAATIVSSTALLVLVSHGEARFHQPFMPMFIMLAAYLVSELHIPSSTHPKK